MARATVYLMGFALILGGCGYFEKAEDKKSSGSSSSSPETESFKVVTYNVGLAEGFVPNTEERVAPNGEALNALDADVICLQEV